MKTTCPYCNYEATDHETLDKQKNPQDGEISFCIDCGEISRFKNNQLIKANSESLTAEENQEVNVIRVAWLKTRAMNSAKKNKKILTEKIKSMFIGKANQITSGVIIGIVLAIIYKIVRSFLG